MISIDLKFGKNRANNAAAINSLFYACKKPVMPYYDVTIMTHTEFSNHDGNIAVYLLTYISAELDAVLCKNPIFLSPHIA